MVFQLRPGERAAYFPDVQSLEYDWSADARSVCPKCGGLTLRTLGAVAACMFCDTERPPARVGVLLAALSECQCDNCKSVRATLKGRWSQPAKNVRG